MSNRLVLFFVLASLGFAPAPFPRNDPFDDPEPDPKADLKKLQGRWLVKSYVIAGRRPEVKDLRVQIVGERFTFYSVGETNFNFTEWTFALNASRRRHRFDLPSRSSPARGIYRLKGRQLTICIGVPGGARPSDFGVTSGRWYLLLERLPD
jgi:uncharacterized protein (TIGR03067 family)